MYSGISPVVTLNIVTALFYFSCFVRLNIITALFYFSCFVTALFYFSCFVMLNIITALFYFSCFVNERSVSVFILSSMGTDISKRMSFAVR